MKFVTVVTVPALAASSLAAPQVLARQSVCEAGNTICGYELTHRLGYGPATLLFAIDAAGWTFNSSTVEGIFRCLGSGDVDYIAPCVDQNRAISAEQCKFQEENNGISSCRFGTAPGPPGL
ncbi:hypothetical protein OQA88_41 [Cercophora sp. LCS_1]